MTDLLFNVNDLPDCIRWFIWANTPVYLFKKLSRVQELEALSNRLSATELFSFGQQIEKEESSPENELTFYICIIALSFKTYSEISEHLNRLRTVKYKWANTLIQLVVAESRIIIMDSISVSSRPIIVEVPSKFTQADSTQSEFIYRDDEWQLNS